TRLGQPAANVSPGLAQGAEGPSGACRHRRPFVSPRRERPGSVRHPRGQGVPPPDTRHLAVAAAVGRPLGGVNDHLPPLAAAAKPQAASYLPSTFSRTVTG